MRITKKIFTDLAIFMIGFGVVIGLIFPFFMVLLGIPGEYVFTFWFFFSCIVAGIIVGAINIMLARLIVGKRIQLLASKMKFISGKLEHAKNLSDLEDCNSDECMLPVDSDDELGESAHSYNTLLASLSNAIQAEAAVRGFNEILSSQLELELLSKNALDHILGHVQCEAGALIVERGGEFEIPYSIGITEPARLLANDNLWKVVRSEAYQRVELDGALTIDTMLVQFRPLEILAFPIVYKHIPIGLIVIASKGTMGKRKIQTLEIFCQSLAIALNNAITYDQLQKLAANDPLTGLYNRRFGMKRFSEEFSRSVRGQIPLGVLMCDIDHFKMINDTYGHTIGDRVLVNLAKIAPMAARKGDLIIRYGGEEFMVILSGADKKDSVFIAERLRHMVEESIIQFGELQVKITISIGVASYPEYNVDEESDLIKAADKALYLAKEQGRNMVVAI